MGVVGAGGGGFHGSLKECESSPVTHGPDLSLRKLE